MDTFALLVIKNQQILESMEITCAVVVLVISLQVVREHLIIAISTDNSVSVIRVG